MTDVRSTPDGPAEQQLGVQPRALRTGRAEARRAGRQEIADRRHAGPSAIAAQSRAAAG